MSLIRAVLLLSLAVVASPGRDAAIAGEDSHVKVAIDYAQVLRIPEGAQTLVMGNPLIADITMLKNSRLMVITGKSFGATNLIVLDKAGQQLGESLITVVPPEDKLVVYRGNHRESLSCHPRCARAVDMADDMQYMNATIESVRAHDSAVSSLRK